MDDLRSRFLTLDRVPVPELWSDIERRAAVAAESGMSGVTARVRWLDGSTRVGTRRSPVFSLVWAVLLGLLLISAIAIGGLVAGAWSLEDFRVPAPPVPSACQPASEPERPELVLGIEDHTGLVAGCTQVSGTLIGDSLSGTQVEITNPANDQLRLEVKWVVSGCNVGATVVFSQIGDGYDVLVADRRQPPCGGGSALAAVQIQLRKAVPANTVSGTVTRQ